MIYVKTIRLIKRVYYAIKYSNVNILFDESIIMKNVIDGLKEILGRKRREITYLETGCIRSFFEFHWSTFHVANFIGERGILISIDNNIKSINIAKKVCSQFNNITFELSDSVKFIKKNKLKVDFALLDSANDKDLIFNEFIAVMNHMDDNGIIIIDDSGINKVTNNIDSSVTSEKGHRVWEFIESNNIDYDLLLTPLGHGTQLCVKMETNKDKILSVLRKI